MTYGELRPYYNLLKEYFGTNNEHLTLCANHELFTDVEFPINETVELFQVRELFQRYFTKNLSDEIVMTLWLNANVNYANAYQKQEENVNENITNYLSEDQLYWDIIEKELLYLYVLLNTKTTEEESPIIIKRGEQKITIDNTLNWLTSFLNNYCFARVLPGISSAKDASDALIRMTNRKRGRKIERRMENNIVNGVAAIAVDYKLVEQAAPKNLCCFIREYMCLMKVIEPNDTYITHKWIQGQIRNLKKKYDESPILPTNEAKPITLEELERLSKNSKEARLNYLLQNPNKETGL